MNVTRKKNDYIPQRLKIKSRTFLLCFTCSRSKNTNVATWQGKSWWRLVILKCSNNTLGIKTQLTKLKLINCNRMLPVPAGPVMHFNFFSGFRGKNIHFRAKIVPPQKPFLIFRFFLCLWFNILKGSAVISRWTIEPSLCSEEMNPQFPSIPRRPPEIFFSIHHPSQGMARDRTYFHMRLWWVEAISHSSITACTGLGKIKASYESVSFPKSCAKPPRWLPRERTVADLDNAFNGTSFSKRNKSPQIDL